jgi:hypothetical protein
MPKPASAMQRGLAVSQSTGETPMPMGVTKKQERQYEHIKESYQERGVSADEAKERAARTVNKQKGKSTSKQKGS